MSKQPFKLVLGGIAESNVKSSRQTINYRSRHNYTLTVGLEWWGVPHNKETIRCNNDVLQVTPGTNDPVGFFGGTNALVKMGTSSPKIRTFLLGGLPSCSTSELNGILMEPSITSLTKISSFSIPSMWCTWTW